MAKGAGWRVRRRSAVNLEAFDRDDDGVDEWGNYKDETTFSNRFNETVGLCLIGVKDEECSTDCDEIRISILMFETRDLHSQLDPLAQPPCIVIFYAILHKC